MTKSFRAQLVSAAGVRERLTSLGAMPKRSLSQNFLIDEKKRDAIIDALKPDSFSVLEIGPGLGSLTEALILRAERVVAVELDLVLSNALKAEFPNKNLSVLTADFLKQDFSSLYKALGSSPFLVAGNLPYAITSPIMFKLLSSNLPILRMALMLQLEAAERFFANPSERAYGPLTILTACAYTARRLFELPPSSFYPQPKVRSAVVLLERGPSPLPQEGFIEFLKTAFSMRRKTLANNLLQFYSSADIKRAFSLYGIDVSCRAEALEAQTLLSLYQALI